ncbi:MAG: endolytic transglycosylase MltG [Patescibacteria group bacterium]
MKRFSLLVVFLLLALFGGIAWWQTNIVPVDPQATTKEIFAVEKGAGIREIANALKEAKLIRDPVLFFLLVKQLGLDNNIQAGQFYLSPAMSSEEIAKALQVGTFDVQVTIPEGKRAEEVAAILSQNLSTYDDSWIPQLAEHEGYLFPDTYTFPQDVTIDQVITTMTENFDKKYASIPAGSRSNFSQDEIVTIASMVEREALHPEDRPLVASVIFNRIDAGTVLNIDATIQYALGYEPNKQTWWKKGLTYNDLKVVSPYNTYTNIGLPPSPIANPGVDVLKAVMHAPETDYMYYVSDSEGYNHYTTTLEAHNANIEKFGL